MCSLGFQDKREIDTFAFRDVEAADCKESPACRWIGKNFACDGRRQNNKTWIRCLHELGSAALVQRREKSLNAGAKIPNQTWLLELGRGKLHLRLQRRPRHLKKLIRGEKPRHHRRNCEGNCDPHTRSCDRDSREWGTVAFIRHFLMPMPRE